LEQSFAATVDAREYEPKDKHRIIFETFDGLKPGQTMLLYNDHDPKPLYYQFQMERPEAFGWEYLEEGPEVWRVAISKKG
jgi:uncharacterized protein (DUF2249 family)